ncbi:MAG: P83/100 family protein [Spirochaeta sp.]
MPRIRDLILICGIICTGVFLQAFEVVEDEVFFEDPPEIEFENFPGTPDRIDSAAEIMNIGRFLGEARELEELERIYAGRYRILRAVDPDEHQLLHADILYLLPDARVDHIDNIRRILSGYLEETYGYGNADAILLARFITIYNAVHRRDIDFYSSRYSNAVMENLTPRRVGLPLSYREWPGNSEIVIPIRDPDATDRLGIISPRELVDERVLQDLRTRRDMGLEDRRDMIDFFERLIEELEEEIAEEREEIAREQEEEQEEEAAQPDADEPDEEEPEEPEAEDVQQDDDDTAEPEPQPETGEQDEDDDEPEDVEDDEPEDVEEREERVEQMEEEVERLQEEVERLRDDVVEDVEETLEDSTPDEVVPAGERTDLITLLLVTATQPQVQSQLVRVEPDTGAILLRSVASNILGRRFVVISDGVVAPVSDGAGARLGLFDPLTLSIESRSDAQVHPAGVVTEAPDGGVFAIVQENGSFHLARFTEDLELAVRSEAAVLPHTAISLVGERVYVQSPENQILIIDPDTLEIYE